MTIPAWDAVRRPGLLAKDLGELNSGGDAEFRVDAVQVELDGAVGEVETLADLTVGEALGGELDDLEFLRRQLVDGVGGAVAASTVAPGNGAESVEGVARGTQVGAGVGGAAPTAQPLAVAEAEPGPGE